MNAHEPRGPIGKPLAVNTKLLRLARYFGVMTGNVDMPLQSHFDLLALHWLFGCFYTVHVLNEGADYRFGFCGPCWQSFYGLDPTGRLLSEVEYAEPLKGRRVEFDAVVKCRHTMYTAGTMNWADGPTVRFDRIAIPFADAGGNVTMLLVAAQSDLDPAVLSRFKVSGYPRVIPEATFWPKPAQPPVHSLRTDSRSE
jgi:hypothetical protein